MVTWNDDWNDEEDDFEVYLIGELEDVHFRVGEIVGGVVRELRHDDVVDGASVGLDKLEYSWMYGTHSRRGSAACPVRRHHQRSTSARAWRTCLRW